MGKHETHGVGVMDETQARAKYHIHKGSAKARGIEFDLTFDEWMAIWGDRLSQRGTKPGQLQMCRHRDEGGYTLGNVRIDTREGNVAELRQTLIRRAFERDWPDPTQSDWMQTKPRYGECPLKARQRAEVRAELGLDDEQ
jgi:hypothetical protein